MKRVLGVGLAIALALGLALSTRATASEVVVAMGAANYKEAKGSLYSWCGFPGPCNVPTQAVVLLEKQGPTEVIIGDTFSYQIQISNRSAMDLIAVNLWDSIPEGFQVESISPQPTKDENGKYFFDLGTIPARSAKMITITGRAVQLGCLVSNTLAKICYEMPLPLATRVIQCNVEIRKTLPEVADLCDIIPMCLTVYNVGSAQACNVRITDKLPEGLVTKDGKTEIDIFVGNMAVGTSKTFTVDLKALRRGEFSNTACVTADRNCYSQSTATVKVVAPELQLSAYAPMDGYICTTVPYEITVMNVGDSPARDVMLTDTISSGFKVERVSDGGKISKGRVAWNLGTLNPGESKTVCLWGSSVNEGQIRSEFCVTARCAEPKTAAHCLTLIGVPGVLTSLRDNCDPVAIGGQVTYTVTATNTGSRDATNLVYTIKLDEGMEYVGGDGNSEISVVDARTLRFAPVPVLPKGGATVAWNVTVRASTPGDKRFTAELKTNELDTVVSKSESTNFYQPNMGVVVAQ